MKSSIYQIIVGLVNAPFLSKKGKIFLLIPNKILLANASNSDFNQVFLKKDEETSWACSVSILEAHRRLFSSFQTSLEILHCIGIPEINQKLLLVTEFS